MVFHGITSVLKRAAEVQMLFGKVKIVLNFFFAYCDVPNQITIPAVLLGGMLFIKLIDKWSSFVILCRTVKTDEAQCNLSSASLINLVSVAVIEEFAPVPSEFGKMFRISFAVVRTCSMCLMKLAYVK